ncbi:MAG: flagellar basal-body MS-ring/collar protein FliF [Candidatus Wallbacteria bacterium]|nr:flagellar basal-body MS-ring/collar protein FliF [Candidatus Wallbacteria bacterium]
MRRFLEQLKEHFSKLKKEQKIFLVAIFSLIVTTALLMVLWSAKTEWVPLFRNMDPKSAGKVRAKLQELGLRFRLADEGGTILVPVREKDDVTLRLASEDALPDSAEGFKEIFSQTNIVGETRERERINYIRGMQGELERTIRHIDQVESVRVHLVLPTHRLFEDDQEIPTASVVLKLKPFTEIKTDQVKGIQNLVAFSVEGLQPKNVKVIDMYGRIISDDVLYEDSEEGKTTVAMKLQREKEKELQNRAQTMLERVIGPGKAVVRIIAELDFDKNETMSREIAPPLEGEDTGLKRSEELEKEQYEGYGVVPGGVPGVDTNIPGYKGVNEEKTNYQRNRNINNYEFNSVETKQVRAPGGIRRLSVSVIVDAELDTALKDQLADNVKTSVGYVDGRDSFQFTLMSFSREETDDAFKAWESAQRRKLVITIAVLGGILTLAFMTFLYLWWKKKEDEKRMLAEAEEEEVIEIEDELGETLSIESQERKQMEERIKELARKNPQGVANLIRLWFVEEST